MKNILPYLIALCFLLLVGCSKEGTTPKKESIIGKKVVATTGISIRDIANRSPFSKQIGALPEGTIVTILDADGYFYSFAYTNINGSPVEGWVGRKCVDKKSGNLYVVNGKGASVLDKPDNSAKRIKNLNAGIIIERIGSDESWYQFKYGNIIGWGFSKYLKLK